MTSVYIYQAALCCASCGEAIRGRLDQVGRAPADPENKSTYDSDDYPKGPYGNGGGEADTPQHCDTCDVFLENPLTPDGRRYVCEAFRRYVNSAGKDGSTATLQAWSEFYDIPEEEVFP